MLTSEYNQLDPDIFFFEFDVIYTLLQSCMPTINIAKFQIMRSACTSKPQLAKCLDLSDGNESEYPFILISDTKSPTKVLQEAIFTTFLCVVILKSVSK